MSRLTLIYTIYGLLYTTFGLGVRHTGQAGHLAVLLGALTSGLPIIYEHIVECKTCLLCE